MPSWLAGIVSNLAIKLLDKIISGGLWLFRRIADDSQAKSKIKKEVNAVKVVKDKIDKLHEEALNCEDCLDKKPSKKDLEEQTKRLIDAARDLVSDF